MKHFLVTISTRSGKLTRNIIAASSVKAVITALHTIPGDAIGAFKIVAKVAA
jgi:hypothetical protein